MTNPNSGRVLVVDDNPQNIELIRAQLRGAGFEVLSATGGQEALDLVDRQPPDVILLDVMMPEMDGHEVCRRLKDNPLTLHIPVVMLTALQEKTEKIRALELGASDFLTKPADRTELVARVRSLTRLNKLHDDLTASVAGQQELVDQLTQMVASLKALGDVSRAISSKLELEELLTAVVTRAVQLSGGDAGIIREYDPATDTLPYRASYGLSREVFDELYTGNRRGGYSDAGIAGYVVRTRRLYQSPDITLLTPEDLASGAHFGLGQRLAHWRELGIRSVLALPLTADELVGVLVVHRRTAGEFSPQTIELLQIFAAQSAVAIQNAHLFERLHEERAAAERARQTMEAIMADMTDGLLVIDSNDRIRYCNGKAAEYLSLDPGQLADQTLVGLLDRLSDVLSQPAAELAGFSRALKRVEQRPAFELSVQGPPARVLLGLVFPINRAGSTQHDAGILLHDVTQERDLMRTKDELLSVVSHELRTPLASLVGFAELLLKRDYDDAQRHEFLSVMYEEGRRLTALINDFLDLQRMESGRQSVHLQPIQLAPVIMRAAAAVGEDPLRPISVELPPGLPDIDGDPDRLLQVLVNLLSNARKYSPEGGRVRITAERFDRALKVSVHDNGLGLPPEAIPQLFQKFYRVDNSDRRSISGTGLGLAICRQIIAEHGGRIGVDSNGLGHGSSFWFTLWFSKPSSSVGDVLIVEDDVSFGRLLEAELNTIGLSSVRVVNGQSALKAVDEATPRAVVLDLLLPDMPGEELLPRLTGTAPAPPVIVATAKELANHERDGLKLRGVTRVIQKGPGVASRVVAAVAEVIAAAGDAGAEPACRAESVIGEAV